MKMLEEIEVGDMCISICDIKDPGFIWDSIVVPKGCPGIVLSKENAGFFSSASLLVKFRNGVLRKVHLTEVVGVSMHDD
jgi:hypothetical protein